eukprot:4383406-Prymnesium_polylepis.1
MFVVCFGSPSPNFELGYPGHVSIVSCAQGMQFLRALPDVGLLRTPQRAPQRLGDGRKVAFTPAVARPTRRRRGWDGM